MNVRQSLSRVAYDKGGYLIARWIRDLKATSNASIRFVVRKRMPS